MLGQHYGLFVEQIEVAPGREFATVLREARERAIAARGADWRGV